MTTDRNLLTIGIDGPWMPMDLARLLHLVVRFYRQEQLVYLTQLGGRNFFDDRLDAVVLKYLAAFDWIAAPLMSEKFNDSYARSEEFVRNFGVSDLRISRISYDALGGAPGQIAFAGIAPVIDTIHDTFHNTLKIKQASPFIGDDSQGKFADIEALYAANMRNKANLMKEMGYSDAELHAIVSPSIEDLHFVSNAVTQGKIVTVENAPLER